MARRPVKVDWPTLTNLRLDPFERTGITGTLEYASWFLSELSDAVKEQVARAIQSHHGQ